MPENNVTNLGQKNRREKATNSKMSVNFGETKMCPHILALSLSIQLLIVAYVTLYNAENISRAVTIEHTQTEREAEHPRQRQIEKW